MNKQYLISLLLLVFSTQSVAEDKLEMEGISIVGNSELPKSLYIVPWKTPEQRASAGKPVNSLTEEILAPVERDVFLRQLRYFTKNQ